MSFLSDALFLASALVDECEREGIRVDQANVFVYADPRGEMRGLITLSSPDGRALAARLGLALENTFPGGRGGLRRSAWARVGRWVVDTSWTVVPASAAAVGGEVR